MRAQAAPMWSVHEVLIGRITPAKPSASSLFCVRFRFSRPQRTCSPRHDLALAEALLRARGCLRRPASRSSRRACTAPGRLLPWGPCPGPWHAPVLRMSLTTLELRLGAVLHGHRVVALGAIAHVLDVRLGAGPPHAVHLLARIAGGLRFLDGGGVHHAPAPQQHVVGTRAGGSAARWTSARRRAPRPAAAAARSRASCARSCSSGIGSLPYGLSW